MKLQTTAVVILFQVATLVYCYDDPLISDLPVGVAADLHSMLFGAPSSATPAALIPLVCPEPKQSDVDLLLYNQDNRKTPITLNWTNPFQLDARKDVVMIIHGWVAGANAYGIPELRDAYVKSYDYNVIVVDWKKLAWHPYAMSVCFLPKIGRMVADFLCVVNQRQKIPLQMVHLVGHSLGAQMSGFIGQNTMEKCSQKIGRITGMDPAGPQFQGNPPSQRLDETDAAFVDIIHTNEGFLGYSGNCGHSDFHVNCGKIQPGCPINKLTLKDMLSVPVSLVCCHHLRALDYMAESVDSSKFLAHTCNKCPTVCVPSLGETARVVMGEHCPTSTSMKGYMLLTKGKPPYAMG